MATPNLKGCRTITVKASQIKAAIACANKISDDWQAELIEVLLIPNVYNRWQKVNGHARYVVNRHDGQPHKGYKREDNLTVGELNAWDTIAGYTMQYNGLGWGWNSVRTDYYGHGPSTTWDGIRRETYHSFLESLRSAVYAIDRGLEPNYYITDTLRDYKIKFVNDL